MNVFITYGVIKYDSDEMLGVFSSEELSDRFIEKHKATTKDASWLYKYDEYYTLEAKLDDDEITL